MAQSLAFCSGVIAFDISSSWTRRRILRNQVPLEYSAYFTPSNTALLRRSVAVGPHCLWRDAIRELFTCAVFGCGNGNCARIRNRVTIRVFIGCFRFDAIRYTVRRDRGQGTGDRCNFSRPAAFGWNSEIQMRLPGRDEIFELITAGGICRTDALHAWMDLEGEKHPGEGAGGDGAVGVPGTRGKALHPFQQSGGGETFGPGVVSEAIADV